MGWRLSDLVRIGGRPSRPHPTTILLSVHKAGSTFLTSHFAPAMTRVFSDLEHVEIDQRILAGASYGELALPPFGVVATRVYPRNYGDMVETPAPKRGRFVDKKLVMLRRDPRDAAVSLYYSVAHSHDPAMTKQPAQFLQLRERLSHTDVATGIAQHLLGYPIREFLETVRFLGRHPQTCLTTYETLVTDFPRWLAQVRDHMGWSDDAAAAIGHGLDREFEAPAREDPNLHKRRIKPGNWRDVFDDRLRTIFEERIGKEMREAGYTW